MLEESDAARALGDGHSGMRRQQVLHVQREVVPTRLQPDPVHGIVVHVQRQDLLRVRPLFPLITVYRTSPIVGSGGLGFRTTSFATW